MESTGVSRRRVLARIGAGAALVGVGSGIATAQDDDGGPDIELTVGGSSTRHNGDEPQVTSTDVDVEPAGDESFRYGGDPGLSLRITNTATGKSTTFEPADDADTYDVDTPSVGTQGGHLSWDSLSLYTAAEDSEWVDVPGTFSGDEDVFGEPTFANYRAALPDDSGDVVAETDEQVLGTQYSWSVYQEGETAYVTRDPAVEEEWLVEFSIFEREEEGLFSREDTSEVDFAAEDDFFRVDLSQFSPSNGPVNWDLDIYPNEDAEHAPLGVGGDGEASQDGITLTDERPPGSGFLPVDPVVAGGAGVGALAIGGGVAAKLGVFERFQ